MDPAVLADLVGRVHVDPLTGAQSLDQLTAELRPFGLVVAFALQLAQPLARERDGCARGDRAAEVDAATSPRPTSGTRLVRPVSRLALHPVVIASWPLRVLVCGRISHSAHPTALL
jgi:hypothetical protein